MNKPTIALDIDGVLADWVAVGLPKLNKVLNKNIQLHEHTIFDLHKTFGVTKKEMLEAYDKIYQEFTLGDLKPVKGAQEAINLLHKSYEFVAITARPTKFRDETFAWLGKHFDKITSVHFGRGAGKPVGGENHRDNKLALCKEHNAVYFVEDNPSEIKKFIGSGVEPLCIAWPWNSILTKYPNVVRGDWSEISKYLIDKLDN